MEDIDVGTEFELVLEKDIDITKNDFVILLPKDTGNPVFLGCGFSNLENLSRKIKIIKEGGQVLPISEDIQEMIKKHSCFYIFTEIGTVDFENKNRI